ncbi:phage holin family protein [Desulfoscipio gibsoniae]|uniref:Toxin secretion/phage lysis holin n=1 Tax=Desulfoscipio gibsoniae DSM 7213 TaxID=767817 RepID=R4KJC6_9FIRM|nr:phage holin family protein [Desulfoscipio gibsoniae]AGL03313.1 toxin secretion/phage lysis holin [Desulfoscipio gibsoniae DSM 7213]
MFVNNFKIMLALLGGVLGSLIGGVDSLIYALVAFVAIDYVTGLLLAIYEKKVSSNIGFKGVCRKVLIFALVALGNIIDQYIIGSGSFLRTMLIMFYLSNEGISILENAAKMEIPFPQKLKDILLKIDGTGKK